MTRTKRKRYPAAVKRAAAALAATDGLRRAAAVYDASPSAVYKWALQFGVELRPPNGVLEPKAKARALELVRLHGFSEASRLTGICRATLRKWAKVARIESPYAT